NEKQANSSCLVRIAGSFGATVAARAPDSTPYARQSWRLRPHPPTRRAAGRPFVAEFQEAAATGRSKLHGEPPPLAPPSLFGGCRAMRVKPAALFQRRIRRSPSSRVGGLRPLPRQEREEAYLPEQPRRPMPRSAITRNVRLRRLVRACTRLR